MDKKTLFIIVFSIIFLAIILIIAYLLISGSSPYFDQFLGKLEEKVKQFFNTTFGP